MSAYALTLLAKADVFQIWSYIAKDNEDAADRVEQAIFNACAFLPQSPREDIRGLILPIDISDFGHWHAIPPIQSSIDQRLTRCKWSPSCVADEMFGAS